MNKKTFTLAVIFLICALGWLGANVYWRVTRSNCVNVFDLVVGCSSRPESEWCITSSTKRNADTSMR